MCKGVTSAELWRLYCASPIVMTFDPLRIAEHIHGHLGWLSAAALLHPAILLRNPKRRAHLSVLLATLFPTIVGAMGAALYAPYREKVKQHLFIDAPSIGLLFERKEHLAFGAIFLAWAGAAAYYAAIGAEPKLGAALRTFTFRAYVVATVLAIATATLGTVVASVRTF